MTNAFDVAIRDAQSVVNGSANAAPARRLHVRLGDLTEDQREVVTAVARDAVVSALHGLLHGLSHDSERVRLLFDGVDVAAESDGRKGTSSFGFAISARFPMTGKPTARYWIEPEPEARLRAVDSCESDDKRYSWRFRGSAAPASAPWVGTGEPTTEGSAVVLVAESSTGISAGTDDRGAIASA